MLVEKPLAGLGVLVTRPLGQEVELCELIKAKGGLPVSFPVLEIRAYVPPMLSGFLQQKLATLHLIIFISANAVQYGLPLIAQIPSAVKVAAIGPATRKALCSFGVSVDVAPSVEYNSEALLSMPEMANLIGKNILIVRGQGGREHLRKGLSDRGADVQYLEVYRRVMPCIDPGFLLLRWSKEVQVVTVTSNQSLENLYAILGNKGGVYLQHTPLFTFGARTILLARKLGVCTRIQASSASVGALVDAIIAWRNT